jgi:hypothetical protein
LATDPEVSDSILGATRFSEKWWIWNRIDSAFVRIIEELFVSRVVAQA